MKSKEKPQVKTYLDAIKGSPRFSELHATDHAKLEELDIDPSGWDWADYDGSQVIDGLWLDATDNDDQASLARVCHLRALAWDAALEEFCDGIEPPTARAEANGKPCVLINWSKNGDHAVYADPGAVVFSRSAHTPHDALYRYSPPGVPDGWLDRPAGCYGYLAAAVPPRK